MSDDKPRYRLKYAVSDCEECIGPKPCNGEDCRSALRIVAPLLTILGIGATVGKGELQFGTPVQVMGTSFFAWRNYHCITKKVFFNVKKIHKYSSEVGGVRNLSEEDPARFGNLTADRLIIKPSPGESDWFTSLHRQAFENGQVADEDIPDSARKTVAAGCHQPSEQIY
ncbi:hypothetical protein DFH08DRAFT_1088825 [Mycena albidolilacea]|uniref:Uncharacterized protein n=1 Tax=Mycena albidolilacea TaxID=1033008 RepID=A0AAD6Z4G0_9AGAR|nr:hypothetical protein DFH08DRAFT_1088825 [Mycena albidolilacea]